MDACVHIKCILDGIIDAKSGVHGGGREARKLDKRSRGREGYKVGRGSSKEWFMEEVVISCC